ncbi:hypothetical protein FBU59_003204, partial [Linderina macrospora]
MDASHKLRVAAETNDSPLAYELLDSGTAIPQPELRAQDQMAKQIAQLWEAHANFDGLSETDTYEPTTASISADPQAANEPELDAYAVRAQVHEKLAHAQSEIMVALDVVQLLLANERQKLTEALGSASAIKKKHDDVHVSRSSAANAAAAAASAAAPDHPLPLPVGALGTTRTDKVRLAEQQKVDRIKFVLGAKQQQLREAADILAESAQRLQSVASSENRFWRGAFAMRRRNWTVMQRNRKVFGDRFFVRYGYSDAGSTFPEDGVAELIREDVGAEDTDDVPLAIPKQDCRRLAVRLTSAKQPNTYVGNGLVEAKDAHMQLRNARMVMFDRELYYRLSKEARVLELGSVRSIPTESGAMTDALVVPLSRDNVAVRFEWLMSDDISSLAKDRVVCPSDFSQWQSAYYSELALVMAAFYQRRQHRTVKMFLLGAGMESRAIASSARGTVPDPFTTTTTTSANAGIGAEADHSANGGSSVSVAKPELLILSPVIENIQFVRWQHIISTYTRYACAAWRRLVDEPIEVVSHFGRTTKSFLKSSAAAACNISGTRQTSPDMKEAPSCGQTAYVIRLRFQGGTVMAFRVDSHGTLLFVKGFFPPNPLINEDQSGSSEQLYINRVFRV